MVHPEFVSMFTIYSHTKFHIHPLLHYLPLSNGKLNQVPLQHRNLYRN